MFIVLYAVIEESKAPSRVGLMILRLLEKLLIAKGLSILFQLTSERVFLSSRVITSKVAMISRWATAMTLSSLNTRLLQLLGRVKNVESNRRTFHALIEFGKELLHGRTGKFRLLTLDIRL